MSLYKGNEIVKRHKMKELKIRRLISHKSSIFQIVNKST